MIPTPNTVLVVTPHPDDFEFGCAGIVTKWIKEGSRAILVVATNGDKGTDDPEMTSEKLAAIRREEQLDAARVLGLSEVVFLDYPDGGLEDSTEFRGKLVRNLRLYKPEAVFTTYPHRRSFYLHRDHRMAGQVTLDAAFPYARDRLHFPEHYEEGLEPHKVKHILFWGSEDPDTHFDISETIDLKITALKCHKSQVADTEDWNVAESVKNHAQNLGRDKGIQYAEAFKVMNLRG